MALTYSELKADTATDDDIKKAFHRLEATFPKRYLHLNHFKIRRKMKPPNNRPTTMRIWTWTNPPATTIDIVAFFFLRRLGDDAPAYTMTVGVNERKVSRAELYAELIKVCHEMKKPQPPPTLHVVNQRDITQPNEDPLDDTDNGKRVKEVFDDAMNAPVKLVSRGQLQLEPPWPTDLFYWEVVNV